MQEGAVNGILLKKTEIKLLTNFDLRVIIVKVSNFTNLLTGGGCMAKNLDYAMLLDFYGDLLTEKQRDIMQLYYYEDLSLSEIAENENISRQGVHDAIKHAEQYLDDFEKKVGFVRKMNQYRSILEQIRNCTEEYSKKYGYQKSISEYSEKIMNCIGQSEELFR